MIFGWDTKKVEENFKKHGFSFPEAALKADKDEMRDEYDFSEGQRGRCVDRFGRSDVVVFDPDVAAAFTSVREATTCCVRRFVVARPAPPDSSAEPSAEDWEASR